MALKVEKLLEGKGDNYIMPFFWQHGEDEDTLRKYMKVIDESNIKAVCVESRPHPDFCGARWWRDMDILIDEAKKRRMKIWILDDSHFPTGYANGSMTEQPDERCRQGICCRVYDCTEKKKLVIEAEQLYHPQPWEPTQIELYIGEKNPRVFQDDRLLGIYAVSCNDGIAKFTDKEMQIDLLPFIREGRLEWEIPDGRWKVYVLILSRNVGYHRSYINMMDEASCKILLDAVYEPHYTRYKEEFGTTIAGFFSDEPELGNGHLYESGLLFGDYNDLPWSEELEYELKKKLGDDFAVLLALLWEQNAEPQIKAKVRYAYMDSVTKLVERNFSKQIGAWCRERGVHYIGHIIEDNNQHARLGSSLGHYYRGLAGQDMAGIDNIGGQVLPQQEEVDVTGQIFGNRQGEFYHYMLGKLGSSAAAIEPLKKGNSMCEIFGNYGWSEGVRLEKYLIDHFLVRGINHYVPHAFSPKEFPDPDCPPHFYAHGNNPQYRHFGALMAYTNRVCELISGGRHVAPVAILYHGDCEWAGEAMFSHAPGHVLADNQIEYDYIPQDAFIDTELYRLKIELNKLRINTQEYKVIIVPESQFITIEFAKAAVKMAEAGIHVIFLNRYPEGTCNGELTTGISEYLSPCQVLDMDAMLEKIRHCQCKEVSVIPEDNRIRYLHYEHEDGSAVYMFVNEGTEVYIGSIELEEKRCPYIYDAWNNKIDPLTWANNRFDAVIAPLKSLLVIFDHELPMIQSSGNAVSEQEISFLHKWKRSICRSIDYPAFKDEKEITLPDDLAVEAPGFSGFVRYENTFLNDTPLQAALQIDDAHEGVELFINGKSQGIQIAPPFVYDIPSDIKNGENVVAIEVATTLERELANIPDPLTRRINEATSRSGITGRIRLIKKQN